MKFDLIELQKYIDNKLIHMQVHPTLPLRIYKYSQECVFSRSWDTITLNMRGTVLDLEGNRISNPFSKFFNLDELDAMKISLPNLQYKVFDKVDGSLIQLFKYNGEIIIASVGSFTSAQADVARKLWSEKYSHLSKYIKNENTYLFELVFKQNKIVVDYGDDSKLVLIAIRNTNDGTESFDISEHGFETGESLGFDVVNYTNMSMDEIQSEIKRSDFINKEGFVIVFENGFRVKLKYDEYFRLHKLISNVNERFVWEFLSKGKDIVLDNIPDETFQFIKDTKFKLNTLFDLKWKECLDVYNSTLKELSESIGEKWSKKDFALSIVPKYKKISGVLFKLYENRLSEAKEIVWKMIMPKYEKGTSGFQSMKEV